MAAAQESLDDFFAGHRSSGIEDGAAVFLGGWVVEEVVLCELGEEVERDHLVIEIGVVVRRVADEVREGGVHAVAVDPFVREEACVEGLEELVEVERGLVFGVGLDRKSVV